MADASFELGRHFETRITEHVEHPAVAAQNVRVERCDALIASNVGEVLEQARADTVTLYGIRYRERHFGAARQLRIPVKSRKRDDPPSGLGNNRGGRAALSTGQ